MSLPGLVQEHHLNLHLEHLCIPEFILWYRYTLHLICSCENTLGFSFFNMLRGFYLFLVRVFCCVGFFGGGGGVCFADGCKTPSQSSSCHSPHALEGSLDSWQHASSRFASNGRRKFTHNKAAANRHWSQQSITKGQITASMWQTALEFVLSCEHEIQSICFHTTTTAITLFSAIHNTQIVFCQGLKLSPKSITCCAIHWSEHKRCALMHV